jgi:hypothetical protein
MVNYPINEVVIPPSELLMCIVMMLTSTLSTICPWPPPIMGPLLDGYMPGGVLATRKAPVVGPLFLADG